MATDKLRVTELDFDTIKTNLKNFFADQTEFTDYDFSGSGLSILLDVLAYNTHYMAYYLNMVANEMFLDSATQRDSVVSLAKHLGYTPRSKTGAIALLNLTMTQNDTPIPDFVKVPAYTQFNVTSQGKSFTFYTLEDKLVVWTGSTEGSDRTFSVINLSVTQGSKLFKDFTFTGNKNQRFIIDNPNIDTASISIRVRANKNSSSYDTFTKYDGLVALDSSSTYYFLTEAEDQTYEVRFGDGVYGKALSAGNYITIDYLTTDGSDANGLTGMSLSSQAQDWGETSGSATASVDVVVTTVNSSTGGGDIESLDSIKFLAPRSFQHQNRAVTVDDYKAILKAKYSNISSLRVWGGEDDPVVAYGKVYIAIKPLSGETLSPTDKNAVKDILKKYKVIGVDVVIKKPEYIGIKVNSVVKYNPTLTSEKMGTIQYKAVQAIKDYNTTTLGIFDGVFRHSQLVAGIDDADKSIKSNETTISLIKKSHKIVNYQPVTSLYGSNPGVSDETPDGLPKYTYHEKDTISTVKFDDTYIKERVLTTDEEIDNLNIDRESISILKGKFESSTFKLLGHVLGSTGSKSSAWNLLTVKIVDKPAVDGLTGNLQIVNAEDGKDITMENTIAEGSSIGKTTTTRKFNGIVGTVNYEEGKLYDWKPFPIVSLTTGTDMLDFIGEVNPVDVIPENLQIISIRDEYVNVTMITDFDN